MFYVAKTRVLICRELLRTHCTSYVALWGFAERARHRHARLTQEIRSQVQKFGDFPASGARSPLGDQSRLSSNPRISRCLLCESVCLIGTCWYRCPCTVPRWFGSRCCCHCQCWSRYLVTYIDIYIYIYRERERERDR